MTTGKEFDNDINLGNNINLDINSCNERYITKELTTSTSSSKKFKVKAIVSSREGKICKR
jgi:hypothetical protein